MQMFKELTNNTAELTGTITKEPAFSHEIYGEGFYETEIEVSRLSEQTDKLPITISERLLAEANVGVGSTISLTGQFRSYNKPEGERSKLMLTVFARDILPEPSPQNPNLIELTGYICKEPVYRVTPFKREICDILLAVNRSYNKSDYIPCITWGRNARFVKNLGIGEKISVSGRIQSRIYQKTTGEGEVSERVAYEVSVSKISTEPKTYQKSIEYYDVAADCLEKSPTP